MYWPGTTAEPVVSNIRAAALLERELWPQEELHDVPVRAESWKRTLQRAEQAEDSVPRRPLGQLLAFLDPDSKRRGDRLDRLHTSDIRTRADAIGAKREERSYESVSLLSPPLIERPQAVVAAPALRPAGARVAYEHDSVSQTVPSKEASTSRSRSCESRFAASGSGSQRTSSISSWAENEPLSGRIAQ